MVSRKCPCGPTGKHNVTNEQQALEQALVRLESALQQLNPNVRPAAAVNDGVPLQTMAPPGTESAYLFLSGRTQPHLGDLAVYGTLNAIKGLPIYDRVIVKRGGPIVEWTKRMSEQFLRDETV
jgi:hypothetical protein